jgi:hypothetical protein
MRIFLVRIVLAGALVALGGCAAFRFANEDAPPARFDAINEVGGSYGGVGIGSSQEDIVRVFGRVEPLVREGPFQPTGAGEFRGPTFIRTEIGYAYEDVLFWLSPNDPDQSSQRRRVAGIQVTSPGAATGRGIEVGDGLGDVRASYPDMDCGEAPAGESLISGNTTFPYCFGKVARDRWIWFGGDPVANISVSRARFRNP